MSPSPIATTAEIVVRELREADDAGWTEFVTKRPESNLYHTLQWRGFIQEVFGHRPIYLMAESSDGVTGVLPMFLVRSPVLGSKLVSLPYDIGSGGAVVTDEWTERSLVKQAMSLARELQVNYLELRYGAVRPALADLGLDRREPVLLSEMALDTEDQVWGRVKDDHRKAIRKAKNRGIVIREASTLEDFLDFYRVYLRVFRDFGTPPYGPEYFRSLRKRLRKSVRLLLAYHQEQCVGGQLLFCWEETLVSKFAACLPEAVDQRAYAALYWRAIQLGLEEGYTRLSWGTASRDQTGLIEFKERWGSSTSPVAIYYLPVKGRVPSIEKYYDSDGFTRRVWRKLPLRATGLVGARLSRWFC